MGLDFLPRNDSETAVDRIYRSPAIHSSKRRQNASPGAPLPLIQRNGKGRRISLNISRQIRAWAASAQRRVLKLSVRSPASGDVCVTGGRLPLVNCYRSAAAGVASASTTGAVFGFFLAAACFFLEDAGATAFSSTKIGFSASFVASSASGRSGTVCG
jgi:hypothetical protein